MRKGDIDGLGARGSQRGLSGCGVRRKVEELLGDDELEES